MYIQIPRKHIASAVYGLCVIIAMILFFQGSPLSKNDPTLFDAGLAILFITFTTASRFEKMVTAGTIKELPGWFAGLITLPFILVVAMIYGATAFTVIAATGHHLSSLGKMILFGATVIGSVKLSDLAKKYGMKVI